MELAEYPIRANSYKRFCTMTGRRKARTCGWMGLILICILSIGFAHGAGPTDWVASEEGVVFGISGNALLRFDASNQEWTTVPLPERMQGQELIELYIYDGLLWLASSEFVANADIRFYDWVVYDADAGAPLPGYRGMTLGDDAVWVAGEAGLGKMDPYSEEWTVYDVDITDICDVASFESEIWVCGGDRVVRFDPAYEKVRSYTCPDELPLSRVDWIRVVGEELWAFGSSGIARYSPATERWRVLDIEGISGSPIQIIEQGYIVWLLYSECFLVYDTLAETFRLPQWAKRLENSQFLDLTIHQGEVHFSTDHLVAIYDPEGDPGELRGELRFPGPVDGLSRLPLARLTSTGDRLVGRGDEFFATYLDEDRQWRITSIDRRIADAESTGPKIGIGDNGLEMRFPPVPSVSIVGSYAYLAQSNKAEDGEWTSADRDRVNLSGQSGRLSGFYDNTDLLLGRRWGGKYKGDSEAHIREIGVGWSNAQTEMTELLGATGYRGGHIWAEHGDRSAKRRRRAIQARLHGGERTTRHAEEFFSGGAASYSLSRDKIVIGSVTMYLDGSPLEENDYTLDHSSGSFFLSFAERDLLSEDSLIRVEYDYWLDDSDGDEIIIAPEFVYNRGDGFTLSASGLHESNDDQSSSSLASAAVRWRSDPDAFQRFSVEQEVLLDPDHEKIGGRGGASYSAHGVEVRLDALSLPSAITTEARPLSEFGALTGEYKISGRLEPLQELPIIWQGAWMETDSLTGTQASGTLLWNRPGLPTFDLQFSGRSWDGDSVSSQWEKAELGSEYTATEVPWFKRLRTMARLRQSYDHNPDSDIRYRSILGRLETSPGGLVDMALYSWGRQSDDVTVGDGTRLTGDGYGRMTIWSSSLIRGLNLYARGEARIGTDAFEGGSKDALLERNLLTSAVLRPGTTPFELEATYSRNLTDDLFRVDENEGIFGLLDEVGGEQTSFSNRGRLISGGPTIYLPGYSSLRLRGSRSEQTNSDSSGLFSRNELNTYRATLDLYPRSRDRWLIEGTGSRSDNDSQSSQTNWSFWSRWERQWYPGMLSRISFSASSSSSDEMESTSWSPSFYLQLAPGDRGIELRGEIGGGRQEMNSESAWILRSAFRIEWRFLKAFLLRAEARPTLTFPEQGDDESTVFLNLKVGANL